MDEKHIADYFIISGVSENSEFNTESKQLISSVLPITDITVIFRGLGEQCPPGYTCIETTPGGHPADLNNGNFKSPNIQICYRRGDDKPPLVDVGVYHEDKERVLSDVEVVYKTPYGRCASTGNHSPKTGTYITYRRAKTNQPFNQLVVVDLCVILNNKSEYPPHAFYSIKKNLNKSYYGMIGSEVFLCYKKTLLSPPSLCYKPQIISRFPLQDYANFPLPDTVPLFCLPTGANIELWPRNTPIPRPVSSTFVLTSDSAQKIYGSALSFYEPFDHSRLSAEQKSRLGFPDDQLTEKNVIKFETYAIKSICILSRWPFFDCFEKFLTFLHKLVFNPNQMIDSSSQVRRNSQVSLEHHISHFLLDVSFPTPQIPTVLVQLTPGTDETVTISQPSSRLPLPLTGASFIQLLSILGVENTMHVLLFALSEQKILLHSLRPWVLTGVAEAISAMLFPFHWQCPYVPLCPLSLYGILNAPLPFIVGIDSRCFDTFTPPDEIICIDLDTQSIFLSESRKSLSLRILPKRAARVLRSSLEKIFQKLMRILQAIGNNQSPQHRISIMEANKQQLEKKLELEIQEAFVRFMATILRGFRSYLLPITRAPTVGATDPTSLFDFEGFLMSRDRNYNQFYQLITGTQMFTHYIEERSFVSDKDTNLAFFDDCEEKLTASDDIFSDRPIKLFDTDSSLVQTDRSVYIPAPEQSPSVSSSNSLSTDIIKSRGVRFGPLNSALFHRHPQVNNFPSLDKALNNSACIESQLLFDNHSNEPNNSFSISRRTKQEVKTSQKLAKKSADSPLDWSKYLVSCCYNLWFSTLPSYIAYCNRIESTTNQEQLSSKCTSRILRYAYSTIVMMQRLQLNTDEICFRVLTLLCGHYGQPALAVRVFFEMKKAGIKPNAVTYGYYNKAVLESRWPDHSSKPTTVLWTKIRNVINSITLFKLHGRMRMERRNLHCIPLVNDNRIETDADRAMQYNLIGDFFHPTTLPINREFDCNSKNSSYYSLNQHRRSLVNRSFSTYPKSSAEKIDSSIEANAPSHTKNSIHKSYSMHLRNGSPDRTSLVKTKSSSFEDDDEPASFTKNIVSVEVVSKKTTYNLDTYNNLKEKHHILVGVDSESMHIKNLDLIDNQAGILITTNPETFKATIRSPSLIGGHDQQHQPTNTFLRNSTLDPQNHITDASEFLKTNSFGEDAQILRKLEPRDQKPDFSGSVECLNDDLSSEEARSCRLSDLTTVNHGSENQTADEEDLSLLKNLTSTPNFKLSSLINDASSLQWSKWTASQNSKIVYKGIKNAATGIVSSLQEIKSSFSISNSNTPSKLLTSAHHKSTATREMLSQWANYFSSQPTRGCDDDSDSSSLGSNDLLRLSNDEDIEPSTAEANDFRYCVRLFEALEKYHSNSNSKEDLIDHLSSDTECAQSNKVAIEIRMTTCSRCNVCHSLLYDEEIMERWSHNESNLNTRCVYCRAKIVPLMSIMVEDRRFSKCNTSRKLSIDNESSTNDLVDLNFDSEESNLTNNFKTTSNGASSKRDSQTNGENQQNFTVPYLSPIVLRKELESVFESSGDSCPASSQFVDEHPIIYWNLLWYFSRINVPTHLALLCLNSKSILNGRDIPEEWIVSDKVIVKTLWDNEKLHSEIGKPLYRLWERGDPSIKVQAILCDNLFFTYSFLERVINLMRTNQLHKAMNLVLNARLKSSTRFSFDKNRHNLYRDLIFLTNMALGPGKLSMDNFEREYKKAFESLNFQQVALNRFDRPPTIGSLFCRKCFKELSLAERN